MNHIERRQFTVPSTSTDSLAQTLFFPSETPGPQETALMTGRKPPPRKNSLQNIHEVHGPINHF